MSGIAMFLRGLSARRLYAGLGALVLVACVPAEPSQGSDLNLRIVGAQLELGGLPGDSGGPKMTFVDFRRASVFRGEAGVSIAGRTESTAYAVNIALAGDRGYWVVPTGVEDPSVAGELTWKANLDFGHELSTGATHVLVQAVNERGQSGPLNRVALQIADESVDGELVIELKWDRQADVDLIVTDPGGITITPKNINTYEPPSPQAPVAAPGAAESGGRLDIDSNADCVIDGRRREVAVWSRDVPVGRYGVRVDLAAPCEERRVSYEVTARYRGRTLTRASGALYPVDALWTHNGGNVALMVAEFDIEGEEGD